jgi:hypothetical protein
MSWTVWVGVMAADPLAFARPAAAESRDAAALPPPAADEPDALLRPARGGALECRAWETYYRRKWAAFLVASVRLVRAAFRMRWRRTLAGAWLVLRANQKWAPFPDNDPGAARALMTRFYGLLRESEGASFAPGRAAELEVEWVARAPRCPARGGAPAQERLVDALCAVYAYCYGVDPGAVRPAAALRAEAMEVSDRWVAAGCGLEDPQLAYERALLVRSYAALLAAVHRRSARAAGARVARREG